MDDSPTKPLGTAPGVFNEWRTGADSWASLRQAHRAERLRSPAAASGPAGVTYLRRPGEVWAKGGTILAVSLPVFFISVRFLHLVAESNVWLGIGLVLMGAAMVLLGAWICLCAWCRWLAVTVTEAGVRQTTIFGTRWAEWSSLGPFAAAMASARDDRGKPSARARVVGLAASKNLRGRTLRGGAEFSIPDNYTTPIATMIAEMNGWRLRGGAEQRTSAPIANAPPQAIAGPPRWSRSLVRLAVLCALLAGAFLVRLCFVWY